MIDRLAGAADVGICIRDGGGRVVAQNALCRSICGERRRRVCEDGCVLLASTDPQYEAGDEGGCALYRNAQVHGRDCDVSLVCANESMVTILRPLEHRYARALDHYRDCGLSPRESAIVGLMIRGRTNAAICAEFCISRPTLRTHLNRIYAKLAERGVEIRYLPVHRLSRR